MTVMSLPPEWDFSVKGIAVILPDGRDSIYACLDELYKFGYCLKSWIRVKGKFKGYRYTFVEEPAEEVGSPFPEKPDTAKPYPENPTQSNTDLIKYSSI